MSDEKIVKISGHEIKIHELTTEEESRIRSSSQTFNTKKKIPETDQAKLDANMIFYSVIAETWPKEWGQLSVETIRKLPAKLTRKLLFECQSINVLQEDVESFLDSQQQSRASTPEGQTGS
ncbi:MAG: hypothetical protein ACYC9R_12860 [Nitrosotalea sp.]